MHVTVSYSLDPGATYVQLLDEPVHRTVSVSDLVMVDLTARGEPVGVEFAVAPPRITDAMLDRLADRFPSLKGLRERETWLYLPA